MIAVAHTFYENLILKQSLHLNHKDPFNMTQKPTCIFNFEQNCNSLTTCLRIVLKWKKKSFASEWELLIKLIVDDSKFFVTTIDRIYALEINTNVSKD